MKMTPGEQLYQEAQKLLMAIDRGGVIRTEGLREAVERVKGDNVIRRTLSELERRKRKPCFQEAEFKETF